MIKNTVDTSLKVLLSAIEPAGPKNPNLWKAKWVKKELSLPKPWCATRTHFSQWAPSDLWLRPAELSDWLSPASKPSDWLPVAATFAKPGGLARSVWRLLGRLANLGGYQGSYGVSLPPQPGSSSGHPPVNFNQWGIQNFYHEGWQLTVSQSGWIRNQPQCWGEVSRCPRPRRPPRPSWGPRPPPRPAPLSSLMTSWSRGLRWGKREF